MTVEEESKSEAGSGTTVEEILKHFLESTPPTDRVLIEAKSTHTFAISGSWTFSIAPPILELHCSEGCNGKRQYRPREKTQIRLHDRESFFFLHYLCSNCQSDRKSYALLGQYEYTSNTACLIKIGEFPPFGPHVPSRLLKLIADDKELFKKGRRCENQGLGIAAFAYYRRLVELQRTHLFDKIIEVATKVKADGEIIETLKKARGAHSFKQSIELAKNAMPESLLIDGHSPLRLLHKALSEGLHEESDEDCLAMASSVRVILSELSDRLAQALKDDTETKQALSRLMNPKQKT